MHGLYFLKFFVKCFVFFVNVHVVCFTELLCMYCAVYSVDIIFVLWCLTEIKHYLSIYLSILWFIDW